MKARTLLLALLVVTPARAAEPSVQYTRDVLPHGLVSGNPIVSPTVFVGFGSDWRTVMEAYGDANVAMAARTTKPA